MKRRPHRPSRQGVGRDSRTDQGYPSWIRGIGQTSVVCIFGPSISARTPQGALAEATDESSDASSHATVTNRVCTERWPTRRREAVGSGRGRSERVQEAEPVGSHPRTPFRERRASAVRQRHDGTRPAHASYRLTRGTRWGLGSRRSTGRSSAQAGGRCRKLPLGSNPRGGAYESDEGRERSGSTERGSSSHAGAGGRHPVRKSAPPGLVREAPGAARCIGHVSSYRSGRA